MHGEEKRDWTMKHRDVSNEEYDTPGVGVTVPFREYWTSPKIVAI